MVATMKRVFEYKIVMGILIGIALMAVAGSVFSNVQSGADNVWRGWVWLDGFAQNFGTEVFGAILTFVLIEGVVEARKESESEAKELKQLKARLIREMGSRDNAVALRAVGELRAHGWTHDGSLEGVYLLRANLEGANLNNANLKSADLGEAILKGANLIMSNLEGAELLMANLEGADLIEANLERVKLNGANLREAILWDSNLKETSLSGAKLEGTDLSRANLEGADLRAAKLREATLKYATLKGASTVTIKQLKAASSLQGTILPDGTKLPKDDTWQAAFEEWTETVAVDDKDYITPAELDDNKDR